MGIERIFVSLFRLSLFTICKALSICSNVKHGGCSFSPWSMCQLCLSFWQCQNISDRCFQLCLPFYPCPNIPDIVLSQKIKIPISTFPLQLLHSALFALQLLENRQQIKYYDDDDHHHHCDLMPPYLGSPCDICLCLETNSPNLCSSLWHPAWNICIPPMFICLQHFESWQVQYLYTCNICITAIL